MYSLLCWLLVGLKTIAAEAWPEGEKDENIFLFVFGQNWTLLNLSCFSVSRIAVDKFSIFEENGKIIIKEILAVSSSGRGSKTRNRISRCVLSPFLCLQKSNLSRK